VVSVKRKNTICWQFKTFWSSEGKNQSLFISVLARVIGLFGLSPALEHLAAKNFTCQ
jgi:hypothetical protein